MFILNKIKSWGNMPLINVLSKDLEKQIIDTAKAVENLIETLQNPNAELRGKIDKGVDDLTKLLAHLALGPAMLADERDYTALLEKIETLYSKSNLNLADLEELTGAIGLLPTNQEGLALPQVEQAAIAALTANEFTTSFKKDLNKLKAKIEKRLNPLEPPQSPSLRRAVSSASIVSDSAATFVSAQSYVDHLEDGEDATDLSSSTVTPLSARTLNTNEVEEFKQILLAAKTYIDLQKKVQVANGDLLDLKIKATTLIDKVQEDLQPLPELIKNANETLVSLKALANETKRDLAAITESVIGTPKALTLIEDIVENISHNLKIGLDKDYTDKPVKLEYYEEHKEEIIKSLQAAKTKLSLLIYHLRSFNPDQTTENAEKVRALEALEPLLTQVKQLKTYLKSPEEAAIKKREIQNHLRELAKVTSIREKYYDTTRNTIEQMDKTAKVGEEAIKSLKQFTDSAQKVLPKVDKLIDGYTPGSKIGTAILVVAGLALGMVSTHFLSKLTEDRTLLNFGQLKHVMLLAGLFIGAACLGGAAKGGAKAGLSEPEIMLCAFFPAVLVSMAVVLCAARFFYPAPERLFNSATNEGLLVLAALLLCGISASAFGLYNLITGQISFKTKPPETKVDGVTNPVLVSIGNNQTV